MKKLFTSVLFFLFLASNLYSQTTTPPVVFTSSNLPIIVINTNNQTIVNEPKITAHLGIIYNGEGNRNNLTDPYNDYDGSIGIELRGFSSIDFSDKKPYGFETRNEQGDNNNVSLLGMPVENDWVLYPPQVDKTLIRNKFIYDIAREMGGQYAPRSRFCEVVLDGDYKGVYVLIEKIKRDNDRVVLERPDEENITGGYLVEMTPKERIEIDEVFFETEETKASVVVKFPNEDDISTEQLTYINNYFNDFESTLFGNDFANENTGYASYIDVPSFIDHILISECFHQLDGLSASQFFYKKRDGKLFMGPVWDFNRSIGNYEPHNIYHFNMWWMLNSRDEKRVPYVKQLMSDPVFLKQYAERWFELREGILNIDSVNTRIDNYVNLLEEAKERNFQRWPDMLVTNYNQFYVFDNYEAYVTQMKDWIQNKFLWFDTAFEDLENGIKTSNIDFNTYEFAEQNSNFIVEFDWSPQGDNVDGVFALADITNGIDAFSDMATIIRLNPDGVIDVRNGGDYFNDAVVNYNAFEYYRVSIEVNLNLNTYSASVTPESTGIKTQIASNYAFRSEQSAVELINGYVLKSSDNTYKFKNFCLNEECPGVTLSVNQNILPNTITESYPNPFSESITLNVKQTKSSFTSLNIYSVDGKLLHQIYNGQLNKGNHEFLWDGNDMGGNEVAKGIYFCRLISSNNASKTIKIVKVN